MKKNQSKLSRRICFLFIRGKKKEVNQKEKLINGIMVKSSIALAYAKVEMFFCEIKAHNYKIGKIKNWHSFKNSKISFGFI